MEDDFKMKLEELFSEIKSMVEMGNNDDAVDLLEANYEAVREQIISGSKNVEEAAILDVIALGYMAVGDFKMVQSILNMVMFLFLHLFVFYSVFLVLLLKNVRFSNGDVGSEWYWILMSPFFYFYNEILRILFSLLKLYNSVVLQLKEVVHDLRDDEPLLESILTHMGSMYTALGKFENSMLLYKRVLEILEKNHGKSELCSLVVHIIFLLLVVFHFRG